MMPVPKATSATGRTPYDSKGRKQGPRGRKPASAFARRRLRRCCGDRDEQTLRHGDEDGWPPIQGVWKSNATPPGRRGPEPSGCSTEDDGDHRRRLAPLVKRILLETQHQFQTLPKGSKSPTVYGANFLRHGRYNPQRTHMLKCTVIQGEH
jgi:hypothetical protein